MLPKLWMADIISQPLKQFVFEVTPSIAGREALKFIPNSRRKPLIDDVISPMSDDAGPSGILRIGPIVEPVDLLVEVGRKGLDPRSKFFRNKLLQDFRKRVALPKILIASRFID